MSVQTQINRINGNIADSYDAVEIKGGTLPATLNSDNLPEAILSITGGGGGAVNDVKVNGESVVIEGVAEVTVPTATSDLNNDSGFITGILGSDVTTALGYTPYNSTNPNGYQTGTNVDTKISTHNNNNSAHSDIRNAIPTVIDNVESTSATSALSAKQGKELNDRIDNVATRGRFLSLWNCVTGLPLTNPSGYPYEYHTGDFFIVNNTGATNYIPNGDTYQGVASTTVYTGEIKVNDTIFYDGATWSVFTTPAGGGQVQDVYVNGSSVLSSGIAYVNVNQVPSGGTTGQVLTKTASGYAWADITWYDGEVE